MAYNTLPPSLWEIAPGLFSLGRLHEELWDEHLLAVWFPGGVLAVARSGKIFPWIFYYGIKKKVVWRLLVEVSPSWTHILMQFSQITSSSDFSSRLASPPIGMGGTDVADTGMEGVLTVVVWHDSNLSSDYRDTIQSFLPQYDSKKNQKSMYSLLFSPLLSLAHPRYITLYLLTQGTFCSFRPVYSRKWDLFTWQCCFLSSSLFLSPYFLFFSPFFPAPFFPLIPSLLSFLPPYESRPSHLLGQKQAHPYSPAKRLLW